MSPSRTTMALFIPETFLDLCAVTLYTPSLSYPFPTPFTGLNPPPRPIPTLQPPLLTAPTRWHLNLLRPSILPLLRPPPDIKPSIVKTSATFNARKAVFMPVRIQRCDDQFCDWFLTASTSGCCAGGVAGDAPCVAVSFDKGCVCVEWLQSMC